MVINIFYYGLSLIFLSPKGDYFHWFLEKFIQPNKIFYERFNFLDVCGGGVGLVLVGSCDCGLF